MPLSRKPYRDWQPADLAELLKDPPAEEGARLDFKRQCNVLHDKPEAKDKARYDILKDVAAMANGTGGALLIGVADAEGEEPGSPPVASEVIGIPKAKAADIEKSIKSLVDAHLHVRPAALRCKRVPVLEGEGHEVLIVEVPQNTYSLSMVSYNRPIGNRKVPVNEFWVRRGSDNRLMTIDEIQYEFDRLAHVRDAATDELGKIHSELVELRGGPLAWFAAVPVGRVVDHVPVDPETIYAVLKNSRFSKVFPDACNGDYLTPMVDGCKLEPSLHGLICERQDSGVRLEIRRNGTVIYARRVNSDEHPYNIMIKMVYGIWSSGLCIVQDLQTNCDISSSVVAEVGLFRCHDKNVDTYYSYIPHDEKISLDRVTLDETSNIRQTMHRWATRLANLLKKPEPNPFPMFFP